MSDDQYTGAAVAVRQFLHSVSAETQTVNTKIVAHANRLVGVKKNRSPQEADIFDQVIRDSAADFENYANVLDTLTSDYGRNLELLTEGFATRVKSLDSQTEDGRAELEAMRREARGLAETATGTKAKVVTLHNNAKLIHDSDHDPRMTRAAGKVLASLKLLFSAYEDLETFALKVAFAADRTQEEGQ